MIKSGILRRSFLALFAACFMSGVAIAQPQRLLVQILEDKSLQLDGEPVSLGQLRERFVAAASRSPQPEVHVQPNLETRFAEVSRIMQMARKAGLVKTGYIAPSGVLAPPTIEVRVQVDGSILVDGERVAKDDLPARISAIAAMKPQPAVDFSAERGANLAEAAHVLAAFLRAGIKSVGVIGGT